MLQLVPALDEGGVERGAVEIAEAIVRAGGRALVASAGGRLERELERAGGELVRMRLGSKNPLRLPGTIRALRGLIRRERIGIVHARSRAPAWAGLFAARAEGAAFVTTYHGTYSEGGLPFKRLYNSVMARGRPVIAISDFIARLVAERHGVPSEAIVTIPRGADLAAFDPDLVSVERTVGLLRAWRMEDDPRPIVLLPARLTRWKGQAVLIEAAARLKGPDGRLPCRIVLAGGPLRSPFGRELVALAERLGIEADVSLVGPVADIAAALKLASVVVAPSTAPEAFGRAAIEAQAMGRPVIASDHGGARETVAHGRSGWLVPPGDPAALAEALRAALALDESARAHMGLAGRAEVARRFSTAAMQAATIEVYRRVLGLD
ncbi:MAG TPA: glycosyltransferase family 4 protein [Paracoccaceae bacterium]|nr:glycosyltransferase family 4 protein [Paracoccaceae bacterium]